MTKRGQYGGRKVREGTVVSDKMDKTVLVAIQWNIRHRLYQKTIRRVKRLMAHDELNEAHQGDRVRVIESHPISRHKRWQVVEVLTHADLPEVAPESIDLELLGEIKREAAPEEVAPPAAALEAEAESAPAPEAAAEPEETAAIEPVLEAAPLAEPAADAETEEAEAAPEVVEAPDVADVAEVPEVAEVAAAEAAGEPEDTASGTEAAQPDKAEARE